ncbi:sensor histidine kinase [Noviherbaspirillum pedocola]|uniref:histidine kinase n=1 Tax=Noviherbaspirillum pedocola TaxID=2801341 RepID=A0A934T0P1_9BURK|nr:sensor histidine kinase [Noviherbaspirillum pedocola]MBK4739312.1 sensor histidine kinase [Noviherbaspirillum pedocola]
MIRAGKSLYAGLALRMAVVLAGSAAILLGAIWLSTRSAVDEAYDRMLSASALQIAENLWYEHGRLNVDVPMAAFATMTAGDRVLYNVIGPDGRSIAGDPEFHPAIPWKDLVSGPVIIDGYDHELPVRIAMIGRAMPVENGNPWAVVIIGQSRFARSAFLDGLMARVLLAIVITGAVAAVVGMFTLHQALSPLKRIEAAIAQRSLTELQPLAMTVPRELLAVVSAINAFMERLATRRRIMQRVLGDTAHQLRTPVTAFLSQIEMLAAERDDTRRDTLLDRLRLRAQDLGALVNQLLHHAMVLHRADAVPKQRVDLKALAQTEALDMLSHADRALDLEMRAPDDGCEIEADAVSVREALRNVLANALRYGARSYLHVELNDLGQWLELKVIEDGPGIPEEAWSRVRQAFAVDSSGRSGASLGLAIVDEVMRSHQGELRFEKREGEGFAVCLRFPKLSA